MPPEFLAPPCIPGGPPYTLSMPNSAFGTYNSPPWAAGGPVSPTIQSTSTPRRGGEARTSMKLANHSTADLIKQVARRQEELVGRSSDKYATPNALAVEKTTAGLRSICEVLREPDADGTILEVATRMCQQFQEPQHIMSLESPGESEWFFDYWLPQFSEISARCGLKEHDPWARVQAYLSTKRAHMLISLVQSRHSMLQATQLPPSHT